MDKIKGKGTDNDKHCHRKQLHCGVFFKLRVLIRQYKVCHLYDVELPV